MQTALRYRLTESIAVLLILLFCYTGISKLLDHDSFKAILKESPLVGWASGVLSWLLPNAEILLAVVLVFPALRKTGFILATGLMLLFTIYILYMLVFVPKLPCSCGGVLKQLSWPAHLAFNIFFTILSFAGWLMEKTNQRIIAITTRLR